MGHDDLLECPLPGTPPLVFTGVTDAEGRVRFDLEIGGCCDESASLIIETDPGAVTVLVFDGIGSPDQDGDLEVQLADFVAFQSRFLATCP